MLNNLLQFILRLHIVLLSILLFNCQALWGQDEGAEIISAGARQPADNPQAVNTVIKTNPLAILWGSIPLTAEYRVMIELTSSKNQSDQIGISYLGKSPVLELFEDSIENLDLLIVRGIRFQGAHKFYINRPGGPLGLSYSEYAPHGFYISPHLSYSSVKFSTKAANSRDVFIKVTHFNANLLFGYQLIPGFWAFDIFAGLGYKKNNWIEHDQQNSINKNTSDFGKYYNSPVKLNLGFNVGVVF